MRVLALLIFVPLQIVFLPLAILGVLLQTYRQMIGSRRPGVSQTGIEVLGGRWTQQEGSIHGRGGYPYLNHR